MRIFKRGETFPFNSNMYMKKRLIAAILMFLLVVPMFVIADTRGFWCTLFGWNVVGEAE